MIDRCGRNKLYTIVWYGSNKSDRLHNEGPDHEWQYKVTFFRIKILCIQPIKAHDNLCFPLRRAYLLLLCIYFYSRVKVFFPIPFYFLFLQASCGEETSRHIYPVGYEWAWIIIVDITLEVNTLGGNGPYLSMCLVETFCSCVCGEC